MERPPEESDGSMRVSRRRRRDFIVRASDRRAFSYAWSMTGQLSRTERCGMVMRAGDAQDRRATMTDQADESTTTTLDDPASGLAADPALRALEQLIRERAILTRDQHVMLSSRGDEYRWLVDLKQIFL